MPNHRSPGPAVVAIAIVFVAAFNRAASAQPFANGDFITYSDNAWGDIPNGTNAASLLVANFPGVYTSGQVEVGIPGASGFSVLFTGSNFIIDYLPAGGPFGALVSDSLNPPQHFLGRLADGSWL